MQITLRNEKTGELLNLYDLRASQIFVGSRDVQRWAVSEDERVGFRLNTLEHWHGNKFTFTRTYNKAFKKHYFPVAVMVPPLWLMYAASQFVRMGIVNAYRSNKYVSMFLLVLVHPSVSL